MALNRNVGAIEGPLSPVPTEQSNEALMQTVSKTAQSGLNIFTEVQKESLRGDIEDTQEAFQQQEEEVRRLAEEEVQRGIVESDKPVDPIVMEMQRRAARIRLRRQRGAMTSSEYKQELNRIAVDYIDAYPGLANEFKSVYQREVGGASPTAATFASIAEADEEAEANVIEAIQKDAESTAFIPRTAWMTNPGQAMSMYNHVLSAKRQDMEAELRMKQIKRERDAEKISMERASEQSTDLFVSTDFSFVPSMVRNAMFQATGLTTETGEAAQLSALKNNGAFNQEQVEGVRVQFYDMMRRKWSVGSPSGVDEDTFNDRMKPFEQLFDFYGKFASGEITETQLERVNKVLVSQSYQKLLTTTGPRGYTGADLAAIGTLMATAGESKYFAGTQNLLAEEDLESVINGLLSKSPVTGSNISGHNSTATDMYANAAKDPRTHAFMQDNTEYAQFMAGFNDRLSRDIIKNPDDVPPQDYLNYSNAVGAPNWPQFVEALPAPQRDKVIQQSGDVVEGHVQKITTEAIPQNFAPPARASVGFNVTEALQSIPGVGEVFQQVPVTEDQNVELGIEQGVPVTDYIAPIRESDGSFAYPLKFRLTEEAKKLGPLDPLNRQVREKMRKLNSGLAAQINSTIKAKLNLARYGGSEAVNGIQLLNDTYGSVLNRQTATLNALSPEVQEWFVLNADVLRNTDDPVGYAESVNAPEAVIEALERVKQGE